MSLQTRELSAVLKRSCELAKSRGRTPTIEDMVEALSEHVDVESAFWALGVDPKLLLDELRSGTKPTGAC